MSADQSPASSAKGWYSRGYLPHFDAPGLVQHITFHLAGSLPRDAIARMEDEIRTLPEPKRALERRKRVQTLLDSGIGSCVLQRAECARIVEDSLLFGDGIRYRLLAWVIMPNHVHVLIQQFPAWKLHKVVQSWKRHTSRKIHALASWNPSQQVPGPLWQRDYWDRFMRNEQHFQTAKHYVEQNPVVAGLADSAEQWPWGSARLERDAECNSAIPGKWPNFHPDGDTGAGSY